MFRLSDIKMHSEHNIKFNSVVFYLLFKNLSCIINK
jgi:hypothetical protein